MSEKKIENFLKKEVEKLGGWCLKFTSPGTNGVPDRMVLYKGKVYFVEMKRPGGRLRPLQSLIHVKMKQHGANVRTVDSVAGVKDFIKEIEGSERDGETEK